MANPYPAVFRDDNADTRLAGTVDFTDLVNQPGFQTATVTLTDAQIKTLPTTSNSAPFGFPLVPDPDDSFTLIVPFLTTFSLRSAGGAYTNVGTGALMVAHAGFSDTELTPRLDVVEFTTGGALDTFLPLTYWTIGGQTFPIGITGTSVGRGLVLSVSNSLGDFTGGNAANTLTIIVEYRAISLPA